MRSHRYCRPRSAVSRPIAATVDVPNDLSEPTREEILAATLELLERVSIDEDTIVIIMAELDQIDGYNELVDKVDLIEDAMNRAAHKVIFGPSLANCHRTQSMAEIQAWDAHVLTQDAGSVAGSQTAPPDTLGPYS